MRREDRSRFHRALVILAPLGLALDIVLSLWVSYMHVSRSANVQVETQWVAGERLAVRAQLVDERLGNVEGTHAKLSVSQGGTEHDLGELASAEHRGLAQGIFEVPALEAGDAQLQVELLAPNYEPMSETIPIEVVEARDTRQGEHTISTSMLQWADDTDEQPEQLRIDLRPFGRLLAGFDNEFFARVTDPDGKPWVGPVSVVLVHGEFAGEVGNEEDPPVLYEGKTDSLGLVSVGGLLTSDVIRIEVRVHEEAPVEGAPPADPPNGDDGGEDGGEEGGADPPEAPARAEPIKRRFRYVSFPGGVRVDVPTIAATPGATLKVHPHSLRRNRPIFVDFHDPTGTWVDTIMPPAVSGEAEREWTLPPQVREGFVQVEAYHYTNDPGEGTSLARIYVSEKHPASAESLEPLIAKQKKQLAVDRIDKEFDVERERKYLDHLAAAKLSPIEVRTARRWLVGSLPIEVHGPPSALMTRLRDETALKERKVAWTMALRWFLLGGGALFILIFAVSVWRADREGAVALAGALEDPDGDAQEIAEKLLTARRSMLFRGGIVVGIMVATLILTVMLMESLVWVA